MNIKEIANEIGVKEEQIGRCPKCGVWLTKAAKEPFERLCRECEKRGQKERS